MKQQKSTLNSYNLFLDLILIQNMVNVFLIAQILQSWTVYETIPLLKIVNSKLNSFNIIIFDVFLVSVL